MSLGITLLILTLLIVTVTFNNSDYTLQIPSQSQFGLISYIVITILGILGIFIFRNIDEKKNPLERVYLIIAIPLGLLYCLANPLGKVPDEDQHARKAMAIAQGNTFFCC